MLAVRYLYDHNIWQLGLLSQLQRAVTKDNRQKAGAQRKGGRIDLDILEEEEWQNLFC